MCVCVCVCVCVLITKIQMAEKFPESTKEGLGGTQGFEELTLEAGAAAAGFDSSLSLRPYTSMLMSCLTLSESSTTFSKFRTRFKSTL